MRVLLVEDDKMIGEAISQALHDAAYAVDWVQNGHVAMSAIETHTYDIALLDLGLPGGDGLEVLRLLRLAGKHLPVLIVTARDAVKDRIKGLDLGADDYLAKPFETGELLARMRAVFRRKGGNAITVMTNGALTLDPATHDATHADKSCRLSAREYALLHTLLLRPGAILSRTELEERIYGWNEEIESNAVEFLIHAIRKKLGATIIKNVRGVGWMVAKHE
ncbi:response regulator transcription factor [Candidatus Nitrotoga sp. AM1P]|uniref:response regulator transcription factor n=1 Tax=Candidatus Nitrotoga sp. AM1P TaxID=2559597 RepID=UPI0010BA503B|nr:response regulator transcription factor [Candidatus Nitrotoga sp. AM1P]BBJ22463.1 DNA-binding response regulator [Candidatus Nitrotoga sp. AM1P]